MAKKMRKTFLFTTMGGFFNFGFSAIAFGSALPAIEKSLNIDHEKAGLILATSSLGFFSAAFFTMIFGKKLGAFKSLTLSMLINTVALFLITGARAFLWLFASYLLLNFGNGLLEIDSGVGASIIEKERRGSILNLMHSLYALGAILSPVLVSLFLKSESDWWMPFFIAGLSNAFVFIFSIRLLPAKAGPTKKIEDPEMVKGSGKRDTVFWLIMIGVFLYVGYEVGFSSWLSAYIYDVKELDLRLAALFPSLLWLGLLVGRLLAGIFLERMGYSKSMLILTSISLFSFLGVLYAKSGIIMSLLVFGVGFGFSAMFPTLQAVLLRGSKLDAEISVSAFTFAASLGATFSSYIIGFVGKFFGLGAGILLILFMILLEMFVVISLYRREIIASREI
ncbi:hypothetical protein AT15_02665 [Kosmotoga arenicorallina S304]|uniref:Major facilitator superfamily (MFS) profile domain-containing protein n=1 Tax=Kosmotoga arenicorallina S304 TaxID=1453497 RepID=A0A182C7T3_9BACT|nr:MFS transporter [Kosmotoga arenicorallina]OAA31746.1 hypothetical protein AT15_02665 [Kosmotoga arenicorallina S304]